MNEDQVKYGPPERDRTEMRVGVDPGRHTESMPQAAAGQGPTRLDALAALAEEALTAACTARDTTERLLGRAKGEVPPPTDDAAKHPPRSGIIGSIENTLGKLLDVQDRSAEHLKELLTII